MKRTGRIIDRFLTRSRKSEHTSKPDYAFIGIMIVITLFGLLMVYDSSVAIALRDFGDQYRFVREQSLWLVLGLVVFSIGSRIDYHKWYALALPMLIGVICLLIAVFLPGIGVHVLGAHRWINLGFTTFQPAEFAKLAMVIYLSAWFSYPEKNRTLAFFLLLGMVVGLVVIEPDLGTSIVLTGIAVLMYFYSGAPLYQFLLILPILIGGTGILAVTSEYRFKRLLTFLDPERDPLGASYHIRQAILALGSGGLFGVGIGKSRQKFQYLPEANTDSIFAIIAEEVGFVGALAVIAMFLFLTWRGFRIAQEAKDTFGKLLALGVTSWFGIQSALNIAAMVALVPLTGIPLPLVSYGGTSLIIIMASLGIVTNVSRYRKR